MSDNNANIYLHLISPVIQSLPIILLQLGVGRLERDGVVVFSVECLACGCMRVEREEGGEDDDLYLVRLCWLAWLAMVKT